MRTAGRALLALLLAGPAVAAYAAIDPDDRAETCWDASRAERIGFSDRATAACKSSYCGSLEIQSCLNNALKPPAPKAARDITLGEATASCVAILKSRK